MVGLKSNRFHATCGEVSVTMFFEPEAFKSISSQNFKIERPTTHWPLSSTETRHYYPDGRMGSNPGLLTSEHGEKLAELAANHIYEMIQTWGF